MILVDAHVHIYDCFDLEGFLDSAYSNFRSEAYRLGIGEQFTPVLLLTETSKEFWFNRLRQYAESNGINKDKMLKKWEFHYTDENVSVTARFEKSRDLFIIAGRQIETAEGLEVLALFTNSSFRSGIPIIDLIEAVKKQDAIPVIPWGFGKWLGRRGKILDSLMKIQKDLKFYLGDNSGRPSFLPFPHHFKIADRNGIHMFPGSDPLPFATEYHRAGRFGFLLEETISNSYPAKDLKQILMKPKLVLHSYGDCENPFSFLRNQLKMQLKKQYSKYRA